MDTSYYLDIFQKSLNQIDNKPFSQNGLDLKVGVWLNSVVLKIQKPNWTNSATDRPFEKGIFFSIWISDQSIRENKLNYNIHALKLRELKGYSIKSREFAAAFRSKFKSFENDWPNVSVQFGPLTLMEGWVSVDISDFGSTIKRLAYQFLTIQNIIDELLEERKKSIKA